MDGGRSSPKITWLVRERGSGSVGGGKLGRRASSNKLQMYSFMSSAAEIRTQRVWNKQAFTIGL